MGNSSSYTCNTLDNSAISFRIGSDWFNGSFNDLQNDLQNNSSNKKNCYIEIFRRVLIRKTTADMFGALDFNREYLQTITVKIPINDFSLPQTKGKVFRFKDEETNQWFKIKPANTLFGGPSIVLDNNNFSDYYNQIVFYNDHIECGNRILIRLKNELKFKMELSKYVSSDHTLNT